MFEESSVQVKLQNIIYIYGRCHTFVTFYGVRSSSVPLTTTKTGTRQGATYPRGLLVGYFVCVNLSFASTRSALTGPIKEPAVQALGVPTLQAE